MARDELVAIGSAHYGRRGGELPPHRHNRREDGCTCPLWVYSPAHPAPTNPECEEHGSVKAGGRRRGEQGNKDAY